MYVYIHAYTYTYIHITSYMYTCITVSWVTPCEAMGAGGALRAALAVLLYDTTISYYTISYYTISYYTISYYTIAYYNVI